MVGGASFKTVGSALLVAEMSASFLQFAAHFPAIGTDVLTRLGELLRVSSLFSLSLVCVQHARVLVRWSPVCVCSIQ